MGQMNGASRQDNPRAILNACTDIDRGVSGIQKNIERLQYLQQRSLDDPDASQTTQTNRELDSMSTDTMNMYRNFVDRIKKIKGMPGAGNQQNSAQVARVDRKLKDAIQKYQQVDAEFRKKLQAQMARQYRIVRPDASDAEVREAVEDTASTQVFSQAVRRYPGPAIDNLELTLHSSFRVTVAASRSPPFVRSRVVTRPSRRSRNRSSSLPSSLRT